MTSDTQTRLVEKLLYARNKYMKKHWREYDRHEMSATTLEALADECGAKVVDLDAPRDAEGKLLNPTPPMIFGRPIYINDSIPFGEFHLIELFPNLPVATPSKD